MPSLAPSVQQELVAPQHRPDCIQRLSLPQAVVPPGQSFPLANSPVLSDFSIPTSGYLNLHCKAAGSKQKVPCPRLGEGSGHAPGAGPGSSADAELTAGADTSRQDLAPGGSSAELRPTAATFTGSNTSASFQHYRPPSLEAEAAMLFPILPIFTGEMRGRAQAGDCWASH